MTKDQSLSSIHTAIPPVLHGVVAPPMKPPRNLCPTFSHLADETLDLKSFFQGDGLMVE